MRRETFDRRARDELRRRPVTVVPRDAGVTLLGDSRAEHTLVDSHTWQPVRLRRPRRNPFAVLARRWHR